MNFGLSDNALKAIIGVFEGQPRVQRVRLFGSRAKGAQRSGSDVDLAVEGDGLSLELILKLQVKLDELMLPYQFDVVDFTALEDSAIREHIERVGVSVFERDCKAKKSKD